MEFNALTTTLTSFINAFSAGAVRLAPYARGTLGILAGIEIILVGLWIATGGGDHLTHALKKLLFLGFWLWFVVSFQDLALTFRDSLIQAGLIAGGQAGNQALLLDPSKIAALGLDATEPLVKAIADVGTFDLADALIFGITYIAIMISFLIIAVQVFLAVLEFYLIVPLASILMPFGIFGPTKFLAEKGIGGVVGASVKLMVLAFIIAIVQPVLAGVRFSGPEIKMNELFAMLLTSGGIAFLSWNAPSLISGLLAGSPSLSAAGVAQNAAAGAMMTAGLAAATVGLVRTATSATGSVAGGVAKTAGSVAGGVARTVGAMYAGERFARGSSTAIGGAAGSSLVQSTTSLVRSGTSSLGLSSNPGAAAASIPSAPASESASLDNNRPHDCDFGREHPLSKLFDN